MRKTVGFLFVLLLATITIITTSSGDETESSHLVHLTAGYGPLIASCDVCHVESYAGEFIDGQDFANTNVCDTCHSPGGAYNGVDDSDIGAKDNWIPAFLTAVNWRPARRNGASAVTMMILPWSTA